jgi:hypothetical protein
VDPAGKVAGTYTGTVLVTSPAAGNSPQSVAVAMTLAPQFIVSASASPTELGSVSGAGTFASGQIASLVATPTANAQFVNWTEGASIVSASASYSFLVSANRSLVANFRSTAPQTVTIATSSAPSNGGTTSGGGQVSVGASTTVVATPASGFSFANWTENGSIVSTSASYTFTASAARALVANFSAAPTVTVSTSSSPLNGGATSGGGTFASGTAVTVAAIANSGFTFANWTANGSIVSTNATYAFIATASRTLVANFTAVPVSTVTISTSSSPANGGTTQGGGSVASGTSVTVAATANSGFTFANWTEGGVVVSSSAAYTFTATVARSLVANFAAVPTGNTINITTIAFPSNGGTMTGGGTFAPGAPVSVTATPNSGFAFAYWTDNGTTVSTNPTYSFTATADRALVAHFDALPSAFYTVTTAASPSNGGATTGGGTYAAGQYYTIAATANPGFVFTNWKESGIVFSSSPSYEQRGANANRAYVATFTPVGTPLYSVAVSADPFTAGNVTGAGTYASGSTATIRVVSTRNWRFVAWKEGNTVLSTSAEYSFTVTGNRNITATFTPIPFP